MKYGFMAPRGIAATKPPHGAPCNRCGLCCVASLCPVATHIFHRHQGPCPALGYDAGGSFCGLIREPAKHRMAETFEHGPDAMTEAAKLLIGSGTGCDARMNGEPANHAFYEKLKQEARKISRRAILRAKQLWRIP